MNILPGGQAYNTRPSMPVPPNSQIVCGGCRTLLMYPQGAQNVRCARCRHITAVPVVGGSEMAQLVCANQHCGIMLMYPRGANQVQCSVCGTVNCSAASNQVGHLVCNCCKITLMYAYGAQSVKCAVCNCVTPVLPPGAATGGAGGPDPGPSKRPQTVVVENPPSVDDDGNEVANIAVGVTSQAGRPV